MENFDREIAKEVGKLLQRTREEKGISLEKVEAATFISERFLKAFEEGAWENLPGKTYVLGYARIYARFLGLDEQEVSALCQRAYRARERHFIKEASPKKPQSKKKVLLGVLVALAVLCSVVLGVFLTSSFLQGGENEKSTTTALVEPSPSLPSETPPPSFAVTLQLETEKVAWIEVTSMGNTLFSGILVPGKIYVFRSEGPIEISGERGNTIQVWFNGEERGYLTQDPGPFQEVFAP